MTVKDKPKLNSLVHTGRTERPVMEYKPIGGSEAARTKRLSEPTAPPWSHLRNVGWAGWWSLRDGEN